MHAGLQDCPFPALSGTFSGRCGLPCPFLPLFDRFGLWSPLCWLWVHGPSLEKIVWTGSGAHRGIRSRPTPSPERGAPGSQGWKAGAGSVSRPVRGVGTPSMSPNRLRRLMADPVKSVWLALDPDPDPRAQPQVTANSSFCTPPSPPPPQLHCTAQTPRDGRFGVSKGQNPGPRAGPRPPKRFIGPNEHLFNSTSPELWGENVRGTVEFRCFFVVFSPFLAPDHSPEPAPAPGPPRPNSCSIACQVESGWHCETAPGVRSVCETEPLPTWVIVCLAVGAAVAVSCVLCWGVVPPTPPSLEILRSPPGGIPPCAGVAVELQGSIVA